MDQFDQEIYERAKEFGYREYPFFKMVRLPVHQMLGVLNDEYEKFGDYKLNFDIEYYIDGDAFVIKYVYKEEPNNWDYLYNVFPNIKEAYKEWAK